MQCTLESKILWSSKSFLAGSVDSCAGLIIQRSNIQIWQSLYGISPFFLWICASNLDNQNFVLPENKKMKLLRNCKIKRIKYSSIALKSPKCCSEIFKRRIIRFQKRLCPHCTKSNNNTALCGRTTAVRNVRPFAEKLIDCKTTVISSSWLPSI